MISFRFHLVSLVAVFLALGLGILSGTTVINRGIVRQLEERTDTLARNAEALQAQLREQQTELDSWSRFGDEVVPHLVDDRLEDREVVLITQAGTEAGALAAVQQVLERAGARIVTLLEVTERMTLATEADQTELAAALDASTTEDPEALKVLAARELADQLTFGPAPREVLARLIEAGFVSNLGRDLGDAPSRELVGADAIVVVAGGPQPPTPAPERFLAPLVAVLAGNGTAVAAAETVDSEFDFVVLLRADDAVADRISTQDNVDQVPGALGLALALADLLETGQGGHYGVKDGAQGAIPPPQE